MRSFIRISRVALIALTLCLLGASCSNPSSTKTETPASDPGATTDPQNPDVPKSGDLGNEEPGDLPAQGMPCPEDKCAQGLSCEKYYGIAGAQGPELTSCEITCADGGDSACPDGQKCVTIADGPGQVCRPNE